MLHDSMCQTMREIMAEEHEPGSCAWCEKISAIRLDEARLWQDRLADTADKAYSKGYADGVRDLENERKWTK